MTQATAATFGDLFKSWREARHLSQLGLATEAEISQKHLSFIESGRAVPSRDMVVRLAEHLDVPLRERNVLLLAAGYAPLYPEHTLDAPALAAARQAMEIVLKGHEPYPALAIDRHWTMVASNAAVTALLDGVDPELLRPPVNVMRLSLHPRGLGPRIANLAEWRAHLLERLRRQYRLTRDEFIDALVKDLSAFPEPAGATPPRGAAHAVVVPLQLRTKTGVLSFFSTTTVFGTPTEVTLSELSLEAFYPADAETAAALRALALPK